MSDIAEKLITVADNVPKVFEAGKKSQYDEFWDLYQNFGNRTNYVYGFNGYGWNKDNFYPKYDIILVGSNNFVFFNWQNDDKYKISLTQRLKDCGVKLDTSKGTNLNQLFSYAWFTEIPEVDLTSATGSLTYLFYANIHLITIEKLKLTANTKIDPSWFNSDAALVNLVIDGEIGQNGFNVQWCKKLSHDSLMSIINALKDYSADTSGTTWMVTLGGTNVAKLTDDELAIIESKGWKYG